MGSQPSSNERLSMFRICSKQNWVLVYYDVYGVRSIYLDSFAFFTFAIVFTGSSMEILKDIDQVADYPIDSVGFRWVTDLFGDAVLEICQMIKDGGR